MSNIYKYILTFFILCFIGGCNDVLEVEEQTAIDGDRVFNDPKVAKLYLNTLYGSVLPGFSATSNVGLTDESSGGGDMIYGRMQDPTSANDLETPGSYSYNTFAVIRNVNLFLRQLETGSIEQSIKESYRGQALFLRAWVYWSLVLTYGGVPIVTAPLDNNDDISDALPRESASKCVELIISDLDESIDLLQDYLPGDYGRVTRSAAAAFKGRVLLFYASPQFDPNGIKNADGIAEHWEAAYQANKEARQIAEEEGHALYPDFSRIFLDEDNAEAILIRKYTSGLSTHGFENSVRPRSVNNSGNPSFTPSWDLVVSFPMKSGLAIDDPGSGYDPEVYWADRDPRFYATIGYNSIAWKFNGRDDERQWTYVNNSQEEFVPQNGFYLKKHVDTEITNTQSVATPTDWIEIRFAEVLLNLAECANETGRQDEAYLELFAIRARAGIDVGAGTYGLTPGLDRTALREVIMNERKIEFAYENKRYWDLRRRNLYANGIDGTPENGLNGELRKRIVTTVDTDYVISMNPGIAVAEDPADSAFNYFEAQVIPNVNWDDPANYANYFNTIVEDAEETEINYLQPKYNFFYLPYKAVSLNSNLEQTVRWADGTFDPLVE